MRRFNSSNKQLCNVESVLHKDKIKYQTLFGKICNDFLKMPWDKILAGLITGLIIYIGAARLFILQDKLFEAKINIERLRSSFQQDINQLESKIESYYSATQVEFINLESKITKIIWSELRNIETRLNIDLNRNNLFEHDLDKRISILEVKHKIDNTKENTKETNIEYVQDL